MNSGKWAQMSLKSDQSQYFPLWRMKSETITILWSSNLNSKHCTDQSLASHMPSAFTKPKTFSSLEGVNIQSLR